MCPVASWFYLANNYTTQLVFHKRRRCVSGMEYFRSVFVKNVSVTKLMCLSIFSEPIQKTELFYLDLHVVIGILYRQSILNFEINSNWNWFTIFDINIWFKNEGGKHSVEIDFKARAQFSFLATLYT